MPDPATLMTYIAVLAGFVFFPGPSILMTLARTASSGLRVGMATSLGIALGDLCHTVLAVIGVSAIVMASASAFTVVKLAGAAYLVYLGLRSLLARPGGTAPGAAGPYLAVGAAFRQAWLAEMLNPKSAMFFLAFLPQFVTPENGAIALQLLLLGAIFVAMGTVATMAAALGAGQLGRALGRAPGLRRWLDRVTGGIYCALGLRLALQER
ncbi:LysE family translocator [Poseidonocella sp. HB161398]|uniref:LysE family translocator n=1 Tax=Poseidonocella sp. HB161398 TaxID=2320855 RepID=UPI0011099B12|nr:LysE family translocator [Poseidonocella sp. HB161398]